MVGEASMDIKEQMEVSTWIKCPVCGEKTRIKVNHDSVLVFFPLYCHRCKAETRITWADGKMIVYK